MTYENSELIQWLVASLFWLSVLVSLCGLIFIIRPSIFLHYNNKLNRWISTNEFFDFIDKPRHIERVVYHYHHLFGAVILLGAGYCMYEFLYHINTQIFVRNLPVIGNVRFSAWLYEIVYYLLIVANGLALIVGLIILVRPSLLKGMESIANRWISSSDYTKTLDSTHSIPEHILPGNIRLFGLIVLLGGVYIMFNTGALLLKGM